MTTDDRFAAYPTGAGTPATAQAAGPSDAAAPSPAPSRFDDGFFAGPVRPAAGPFGGGHAGIPAQAGSVPAAPSPFGAPPAGPPFGTPAPASPFGTAPVGAAAAPFGSPFGALPAAAAPVSSGTGILGSLRSTPGGRLVLRIGIGLAVSVVLGVFGVGRFAGLFAGGPTAPETLGGMSRSSDPELQRSLDDVRSRMEAEDGGKYALAVYGDVSAGAILVVGRGHVTDSSAGEVQSALTSFGAGGIAPVGSSWCGTTPNGVSACVRADEHQVVLVAGTRAPADLTPLVDEAWDDQ